MHLRSMFGARLTQAAEGGDDGPASGAAASLPDCQGESGPAEVTQLSRESFTLHSEFRSSKQVRNPQHEACPR